VLWAILLMSLAVFGLIAHLSRGMDESIYAEKEFRARLLIQSARTISTHPDIEWGDPLLHQRVSSVSSYEVVITTEGSKLAINQIAANPVQRQFARRLFEKWGMESRMAETLSDSLADWIDADGQPRPYGAEREYYIPFGHRNFPFNKPFVDLDDMMLVRGADELARVRPNWRSYFTRYGDGTIDVHRASAEMLEALFDVTPSEISRFISVRKGPDGIADTVDDPRFTSLPQVRSLLDVPTSKYSAVSNLLTLDHPIKRTECYVEVGNVSRKLTIIKGPGVDFIQEE